MKAIAMEFFKQCRFYFAIIVICASGSCAKQIPARDDLHLYLANKFSGHQVGIRIEGELIFFGQVVTEASTQLAASIATKVEKQEVTFKIYTDISPGERVEVEQVFNLKEGRHIVVFFSDKKISFEQMLYKPDFY